MEQYDNLVSEYNRECDRNRSLVNQYNSIVRQIDAEIRRYNILQQDVGECQSDVARSNSYVGSLSSTVVPPLAQKGERLTRTGHKLGYSGGKEKSCIDILDELSDSYNKLKNQSYATKEMTDLVMQYFSRYGEYNKVRNYALGYVIGVDANIWRSDTPKKVISKAYLSNSDYWLSSAMMAIVHWIDNEKEAADRAIKQALDKDPKKTALFFMLVNLRFELHDAARAWYRLFMELIDENNIPDEFQYILQALLCGCFGKDSEFEHECLVKIQSLIDSAFKRNPNIGDQLVKHVSNHYHSIVNQTRNQYTMMGRAIPNYSEMLSLLSEAEKNSIILERYKFANDSTIKKKSLAFSIEDTLYSLISAYDDEEKAHLDKIKYSDAVMKAKGNIEVAEKMLKQQRELEKQNQNIAYYLVNIAVSTDQNISMVVRKFALKIVGKYCRDGALMFANGYRSKYKEEYGYTFDGWSHTSDENGYAEASESLTNHYKKEIKALIRQDKTVKRGVLISIIGFIAAAIVGVVVYFNQSSFSWEQLLIGIISTVVLAGLGIVGIYITSYQKQKIRAANQIVIENGLRYLKLVLEDIKNWKMDYKKQDSIIKDILSLLE